MFYYALNVYELTYILMLFCIFTRMQIKSIIGKPYLSIRMSLCPHVCPVQQLNRSGPHLEGRFPIARGNPSVLIVPQNNLFQPGYNYHWFYCCRFAGSVLASSYLLFLLTNIHSENFVCCVKTGVDSEIIFATISSECRLQKHMMHSSPLVHRNYWLNYTFQVKTNPVLNSVLNFLLHCSWKLRNLFLSLLSRWNSFASFNKVTHVQVKHILWSYRIIPIFENPYGGSLQLERNWIF